MGMLQTTCLTELDLEQMTTAPYAEIAPDVVAVYPRLHHLGDVPCRLFVVAVDGAFDVDFVEVRAPSAPHPAPPVEALRWAAQQALANR